MNTLRSRDSRPAAGRRPRHAPPRPSPGRLPAGPPAGALWADPGQPTAAERWLYGRHAVRAALANPARRWHRLAALTGQAEEARALAAGARAPHRGNDEPIQVLDRASFAAIFSGEAVHQGLALEVEPLIQPTLEDVLRRAAATTTLIALDRVSDPQNVGAVLRSAAAFGAAAVILARHGAPPAGGALAKAASGALETVPLIRVVNLARALDRLKEAGFWICGLDENAPQALAELDLGARTALVLGAEGGGIRRLVREHCDHLVRLPTRPVQPTLNVSNATAIALYELARRHEAG